MHDGNATATVSWSSLPNATDNVDVLDSSDIVCQDNAGNDVTSGGTYRRGTTVVTCRVKDSARNEGLCQFSIEVEGSQCPLFLGRVRTLGGSMQAGMFGFTCAQTRAQA